MKLFVKSVHVYNLEPGYFLRECIFFALLTGTILSKMCNRACSGTVLEYYIIFTRWHKFSLKIIKQTADSMKVVELPQCLQYPGPFVGRRTRRLKRSPRLSTELSQGSFINVFPSVDGLNIYDTILNAYSEEGCGCSCRIRACVLWDQSQRFVASDTNISTQLRTVSSKKYGSLRSVSTRLKNSIQNANRISVYIF